jgi:hypothetical protein
MPFAYAAQHARCLGPLHGPCQITQLALICLPPGTRRHHSCSAQQPARRPPAARLVDDRRHHQRVAQHPLVAHVARGVVGRESERERPRGRAAARVRVEVLRVQVRHGPVAHAQHLAAHLRHALPPARRARARHHPRMTEAGWVLPVGPRARWQRAHARRLAHRVRKGASRSAPPASLGAGLAIVSCHVYLAACRTHPLRLHQRTWRRACPTSLGSRAIGIRVRARLNSSWKPSAWWSRAKGYHAPIAIQRAHSSSSACIMKPQMSAPENEILRHARAPQTAAGVPGRWRQPPGDSRRRRHCCTHLQRTPRLSAG